VSHTSSSSSSQIVKKPSSTFSLKVACRYDRRWEDPPGGRHRIRADVLLLASWTICGCIGLNKKADRLLTTLGTCTYLLYSLPNKASLARTPTKTHESERVTTMIIARISLTAQAAHAISTHTQFRQKKKKESTIQTPTIPVECLFRPHHSSIYLPQPFALICFSTASQNFSHTSRSLNLRFLSTCMMLTPVPHRLTASGTLSPSQPT
jgi:hypothetical protein